MIGRTIAFVPVLSTLLTLFFLIETPWRYLFLFKYSGVLAVLAFIQHRKAPLERWTVERRPEMFDQSHSDLWAEVWPLTGAIFICGIGLTFAKRDWRVGWITLVLGALIFLGLVLRWMIYDRWLVREVRALIASGQSLSS